MKLKEQINNLAQKYQVGGKVKSYSQLPYDINDIRSFYNRMIGSNWYSDRLRNNGYNAPNNNGFGVTPQSVSNRRLDAVNLAKTLDLEYLSQKMDNAKTPQEEAYWDELIGKVETEGSFYNGKDVYFDNYIQPDELKAHPRTILTHEYGHAETEGFPLSNYEFELLNKSARREIKDTHDKDPYEMKSDINTIRYNLYRSGLFDPNTGKYKTKSGRFEKELLEKVKTDFSGKRLRSTFGDEKLIMLMNTIAQNDFLQNSNNV